MAKVFRKAMSLTDEQLNTAQLVSCKLAQNFGPARFASAIKRLMKS